jgi:hypothetical protein
MQMLAGAKEDLTMAVFFENMLNLNENIYLSHFEGKQDFSSEIFITNLTIL